VLGQEIKFAGHPAIVVRTRMQDTLSKLTRAVPGLLSRLNTDVT